MATDLKLSQLPAGSSYTGDELLMLLQDADNVAVKLSVLAAFWRLGADKTIYVRKDGNDVTGDGTQDDSVHAFLTIARAVDEAFKYQLNKFSVSIQLGDGVYPEVARLSGSIPKQGFSNGLPAIILRGNSAAPGNVVVGGDGDYSVLADGGNNFFRVEYLTIVNSSGLGRGVCALNGAYLDIGAGVVFGPCSGSQVSARQSGVVTLNNAYTINGGSTSHLSAYAGGVIVHAPGSVTVTGAPAFTTGFAKADNLGVIDSSAVTFTGSATGSRYAASNAGRISTHDAGANYFPGDAAGTVSDLGSYDADCAISSQSVVTALGFTPIQTVTSAMITDALGYTPISGITSSMVTTALGYTPSTGAAPLPSPEATGRALSDGDLGKPLSSTSATPVTFTIPSGLTAGFSCAIVQSGAGQVTVAAGAGVTLHNVDTQFKTSGQYAVVGIINTATDVYNLAGSTGV